MGAGRELYGRRRDGSEFPVEISLGPLESEDGTLLISSAIRDITERRRGELEASFFTAVVESSRDAIIGTDLDGVITSWNPGAERLYGYTAPEICGRSVLILVPPGQGDDLPEILRRARDQVDDIETVRVRKDGTQVDVALTVSKIRDRDDTVIGASTIARDIGVRLRYQQQLRFLAEHDALTGARNRRRFELDISEQVGRAKRYGERASLILIDADRFKQINDTYGHRTGDRALQDIAAALKRRMRDTDTVARIGGDEFAVLLPYADAAQAGAVAADLRQVIGECTIDVADRPRLRLSVSIGVVQINQDTVSDEAILAQADAAMYADKTEAPIGR
jgi:diguanylate cyclase (GGDEF)-like protein/PAS domain S-box-containing protein